jgi:biopolymer transport protein TolR
MTAGINVDLPESAAAPVSGNDEPVSISIKENGEVYIQNTLVAIEDVGPKLQAITGEKPETRIWIRGDKNIDYGRVMWIAGQVNAAGFTKVSLITEQSDQ